MPVVLGPDLVGLTVVFRPSSGRVEEGVVTFVNDRYAFVRYVGDKGSKATHPDNLDLLLDLKQLTEVIADE